MILEHENYRSYLKATLADLVNANSAYSMRAFARRLGLSSSHLSEVLNSKKSLSLDAALKVCMKLDLNETETRYFCLLVQKELEQDPTISEKLEESLNAINPARRTIDLSVELFRLISDWYPLAILELSEVTDFELTAKSASLKLSISHAQADAAIDRLLRLELLERDSKGRLRRAPGHVLAQSAVSNLALKNFHAQILEKASKALQAQGPEERVSSSDLVAIDPRYVKEVKKLSDRLTSDLLKLSEKSKRKTHVYCLNLNFFNLTCERKTSV